MIVLDDLYKEELTKEQKARVCYWYDEFIWTTKELAKTEELFAISAYKNRKRDSYWPHKSQYAKEIELLRRETVREEAECVKRT